MLNHYSGKFGRVLFLFFTQKEIYLKKTLTFKTSEKEFGLVWVSLIFFIRVRENHLYFHNAFST